MSHLPESVVCPECGIEAVIIENDPLYYKCPQCGMTTPTEPTKEYNREFAKSK